MPSIHSIAAIGDLYPRSLLWVLPTVFSIQKTLTPDNFVATAFGNGLNNFLFEIFSRYLYVKPINITAMRKMIFLSTALLALICCIATTLKSNVMTKVLLNVANIEVMLTSGENTSDNVFCKCSKYKDNDCKVDNWGAQCASGRNIKCSDYNSNCS